MHVFSQVVTHLQVQAAVRLRPMVTLQFPIVAYSTTVVEVYSIVLEKLKVLYPINSINDGIMVLFLWMSI